MADEIKKPKGEKPAPNLEQAPAHVVQAELEAAKAENVRLKSQPPPAPPALEPAAELELLRAENARLKAAMNTMGPPTGHANLATPHFGTQPSRAVDLSMQAQPGEADARCAISRNRHPGTGKPDVGGPAPGDRLWSVMLPGHKSRVIDPERGIALMVTKLPVWAHNQGEAYLLFCEYNGICSTVQQPRFELMDAA